MFFYGISTCIWLILLAKSLAHSIWYASKILHVTRYAEQNKEVRGTPWGEGGIASNQHYVKLMQSLRIFQAVCVEQQTCFHFYSERLFHMIKITIVTNRKKASVSRLLLVASLIIDAVLVASRIKCDRQ